MCQKTGFEVRWLLQNDDFSLTKTEKRNENHVPKNPTDLILSTKSRIHKTHSEFLLYLED